MRERERVEHVYHTTSSCHITHLLLEDLRTYMQVRLFSLFLFFLPFFLSPSSSYSLSSSLSSLSLSLQPPRNPKCGPFSVVVAAGPFTPSDNIDYDPLHDLLKVGRFPWISRHF